MDETEITNNEYRQFERWVVDSMIRTEMKLFKNRRGDTLLSNNVVNGDTLRKIDWSVRLNENSDEYKFLYDSMFVKTYVDGQPSKEENFIYRYEELDVRALSKSNSLDEEL